MITKKKVYFCKDLKINKIKTIREHNGNMIVFESKKNIPFNLKRFFYINTPNKSLRGHHAHKTCSQYLTCITGEVHVTCNDGVTKKKFILDSPNKCLLIPPTIWAHQEYKKSNSSVLVLCDEYFTEKDYIRNFDHFIKFRKKINEKKS